MPKVNLALKIHHSTPCRWSLAAMVKIMESSQSAEKLDKFKHYKYANCFGQKYGFFG